MSFLIQFIDLLYWVLTLAILARVLLSWTKIDPYHPAARLLVQVTEPILAPIRRFLPTTAGLDFSPVIAIVALGLIRRLLVSILLNL
ncbi:MAG TPA: YggT family protein [Caldilineae bacterium]|nr:YggT family protein [Caldilineae bacterium]